MLWIHSCSGNCFKILFWSFIGDTKFTVTSPYAGHDVSLGRDTYPSINFFFYKHGPPRKSSLLRHCLQPDFNCKIESYPIQKFKIIS
jgi:hypothetical protein